MANGIYTALSGALSDQRRMELLSNNLANVNTTAYKQIRTSLEEVKGPDGNKQVSFNQTTSLMTDLNPGPIVATDNPMDIALTDGVYLAVQDQGRNGFVRGGTLMVRPSGELTTLEGYNVLNENNKPVNLPPGTTAVEIMADGSVTVDGAQAARMKLTEFSDQQALARANQRLLIDPGNAGESAASAVAPIMTGYRQTANINVVDGMTNMIAAHRNFEATMKVIQNFQQVEKRSAREVGSRV